MVNVQPAKASIKLAINPVDLIATCLPTPLQSPPSPSPSPKLSSPPKPSMPPKPSSPPKPPSGA